MIPCLPLLFQALQAYVKLFLTAAAMGTWAGICQLVQQMN